MRHWNSILWGNLCLCAVSQRTTGDRKDSIGHGSFRNESGTRAWSKCISLAKMIYASKSHSRVGSSPCLVFVCGGRGDPISDTEVPRALVAARFVSCCCFKPTFCTCFWIKTQSVGRGIVHSLMLLTAERSILHGAHMCGFKFAPDVVFHHRHACSSIIVSAGSG